MTTVSTITTTKASGIGPKERLTVSWKLWAM